MYFFRVLQMSMNVHLIHASTELATTELIATTAHAIQDTQDTTVKQVRPLVMISSCIRIVVGSFYTTALLKYGMVCEREDKFKRHAIFAPANLNQLPHAENSYPSSCIYYSSCYNVIGNSMAALHRQ